jgi:hypothetical protein
MLPASKVVLLKASELVTQSVTARGTMAMMLKDVSVLLPYCYLVWRIVFACLLVCW